MTTSNQLIEEYEEYAKKKDFILNPNSKFVEVIINGLIKNEIEKGERYCPCRRITGNKEEDKKIICPCVYHEDEIKELGKCHCMLFMRKPK
jgi:ferredoxin-thioredoxin reductase catalytic chain